MQNKPKVPGSSFPMFSRGAVNWRGVVGNTQSPKVYPGAVIDVDDVDDFFTSGSKWFLSKEKMEEYYVKLWKNAVPLDSDLVEAILQHWKWLAELREKCAIQTDLNVKTLEYSQQCFAFCETFSNALDKIYMEALWRKINSKTK